MKKIHLNKWKHKSSLYLMLFCLSLPLALTPLSVSATETETESEQTAPTSQKDASETTSESQTVESSTNDQNQNNSTISLPESSSTTSLAPSESLTSDSKKLAQKEEVVASTTVAEPKAAVSATISVPDPNLKQTILSTLGLATTAELTQTDMDKLTNLTLNSVDIYSLVGLEHATNLSSIYINVNNKITDFTPLESLTKLTFVTLQTSSLTSDNFPNLTASQGLTNLSIGGTSVDNSVLAKIVNLKALVRLYMDSNMNITNIEPLKVLPNLKSLSVQFCGITDFTVIKDFPIMSDLAAFGQNTGRNDPPTTVTRSSLKYNEDEQSVYIPFSMMPNRMTNFDGYIPPFSTSNSASNTYFDFNGTQLPASRLQIDDNGITINSVSPEEYQGIKSFEYNARLNNPAGTYAVPDGYTFYAISSGTYLHQFDVVDDGAPVTVKYQDENGQELAPSELLNGYVGATYNSKELSFQGYSLIKVDGDATGKFTDSPQTVTYIYQKNAKLLGQVTVKYIDTDGKALFGDVIQTGNIGETYHTEKKELTGYTFKNIIGNASGQYTNSPQTVTYVYEKNANPNKPEEVIPDSSDKNNVNPDSRENETTKGSKTVKDKESVVTSKEKNLPETGDKEQGMKKITLFGSFLLILGSLVLFIRFRKVD